MVTVIGLAIFVSAMGQTRSHNNNSGKHGCVMINPNLGPFDHVSNTYPLLVGWVKCSRSAPKIQVGENFVDAIEDLLDEGYQLMPSQSVWSAGLMFTR